MKNFFIPFCCLLVIVFYSCKSKSDEPGALESLGKLKELSENIVKEAEKSTSRWEERKAKGDTVAMPYKELQAYLPEISGYTTEQGPKGSQTNTPGLGSWSQGEQEYVNGDKRAEVSIMDYNAAHQAFAGLTAMYGLGMSMEDDEKRQGPVDLGIKNVAAYEIVYKKEKRSELTLVAGDRFIISLKSEGEDESFLRSIAKSMKLDELANK
ncbi:MAG TPA: hypothetical protein PK339_01505 [Flavitalea sp.]|nr:hypothetical protein [Flavitalea sp.]